MKQYVDFQGRLYDVEDGYEAEAKSQGLMPATAQDIQDHNKVAKYGGVGQKAIATGEAVVRGATLGFVEGFGEDEDIRGRKEVLEEENPLLSGGAELVPDVAAGLLTGGASALATGAVKVGAKQAVKQGVKQTIKAGGRAGAAAALVGESLGSGAVTASQQAYDQHRQFLHEDIGQDVSNLAIAAGLNMFFGGAAAGIAAKVGKKGAKAASKADDIAQQVDDVAAKAEREALGESAERLDTPTTLDDAAEELDDGILAQADAATSRETAEREVQDVLDGKPQKGADDYVPQDAKSTKLPPEPEQAKPSIKRSAELARAAPIIRETVRREAMPVVNRMIKFAGDTQSVDKKLHDGISKHLGTNYGAQIQAAHEAAKEAAELAGVMRANARAHARELAGYKAKLTPEEIAQGIEPVEVKLTNAQNYEAKPSAGISVALEKQAKKLAEASSGPEATAALDRFRQMMQSSKLSLERGKMRAAGNPDAYARDIKLVEALQEKNRLKLEDEDIFGNFAKMQRDYNKTWTDGFFKHAESFQRDVLRRTGTDYEGKPIMEAWEANLDHVIANPKLGERRHVMGMIDALESMVENNAKWGSLPQEEITSKLSDLANLRRMFKLADEAGEAAQRFDALSSVPGVGSTIREVAAGDLVGQFRRLAGAVDERVERSVDEWFTGSYQRAESQAGAKASKLSKLPDGAKRAAKAAKEGAQAVGRAYGKIPAGARRRVASRTLQEFMGEDDSPTSAYKKQAELLRDPEKFARDVAKSTKDLAMVSPSAASMVAGHAFQAREYLMKTMPAPVSASMRNPAGYPPSIDAISDWAAIVNTVRNPLGVLQHIARGDIRAEELRTLQALDATRPLYEKLQHIVLRKLATQQSKRELSDRDVFKMSALFGAESIEPAFSSQAARVFQEAERAKLKPAPQSRAKPVDTSRLDPANIAKTGATYGTDG